MNNFGEMLFDTDLDGTLFFKSKGSLFTFITARSPKTSESICGLIRSNVPYGCINGGGIYRSAQEKNICFSRF